MIHVLNIVNDGYVGLYFEAILHDDYMIYKTNDINFPISSSIVENANYTLKLQVYRILYHWLVLQTIMHFGWGEKKKVSSISGMPFRQAAEQVYVLYFMELGL